MLKSVEDVKATKKRLKIEIPADVIEKEISNSLEKLKHKAKIPGFRSGMAPINLIEKRFGKEVEAEVLDKVIPEYYTKALKEAELIPVTTPVFDERLDFKRNNPLNLSFTIEVMPKIENLNYENIKIKDIPAVVNEAEIEAYLKRLQEEKVIYEVAEKEVELDDLVTFEYSDCKIIWEENPPSIKDVDNINVLKEEVLKIGNEIFPPDIMERVMGKKKDDIVEFTTTFNEICKSKVLAGKTAEMKFVIKEIKKKNLPAIDDEFAKDVGFENISEMREKIKERIYAAKKEHIKRIQKAEIVSKLIESHNFEVPDVLVSKEMESLMMEESLSQKEPKETISETKSPEQEKKDLENLHADMGNRAVRNVQASIIVDAIGRKEGIMVTDDELKDRVSLLAQRLSATPEAVMNFYKYKEGSLEGLRHSIFEEKVMDMLLSKATMNENLI
ncbi:MAG: trigger factor [Nitrospirota bacterium]